MLGQSAANRLWKACKVYRSYGHNSKLSNDTILLLKAYLIYRDLAAQMQWWGTGDETSHKEYLDKMDEQAKAIYKCRKNHKVLLAKLDDL